ncbi:MAG: oligosaccharide flippase family protein [Nanoarchaeota archaeon]
MFKKNRGSGQHEMFRAGSIFFFGSMSVAILNYFYHVFMGRLLGPFDYGVLGSLFAIIYLATFASNTFTRTISKYSAEFESKGKKGELKGMIKRGFFKILFYGLIVFLIYLAFIPLLSDFMNIESRSSMIIVGLVGFLSIIGTVVSGSLNGLQKFGWQNFLAFDSALVKFLLALILVYLGFGINGALLGILIGTSIVILFGFFPVFKELKGVKSKKFDSKEIYLYAVPVFFASLLPLLLITFDQILVKHFFSSLDAGYYAAAGNIAKIIWFGSGFLVSALFPKVVSLRAQGKKTNKLLVKSLIYTSFLALIGIAIYFASPRLIVLFVYGKEYMAITSLIGMFGLGLGLFSVSQIFITYNLAIERYGFIYIIFIGFILQVLGMLMFHQNLLEIIKVSLLAEAFILFGLVIYNWREFN